MGLARGVWLSRNQRRLLITVAAALIMLGLVVLRLWATSPVWLAGLRAVTVAVLGWVRTHLLTVTVAGLAVSVAGLGMPLLLRWLRQRDAADERRRVRDRAVMLARVRHRWITGVLEQSLANQVHIRLGLTRRPEAVWQADMMLRRPGQPAEPLSANTPLSAVFDELGGGCLFSARQDPAKPPPC
jgi:hypothetical protein